MTLSQSKNDDYILIEKSVHEELRKNIEDYRKLIVEAENLKITIQNLKTDNDVSFNKILDLQKQVVLQNDKIRYLEQTIKYLTERLEKSQRDYVEKSKMYDEMVRLHYRDQAKIYTMNGYKTRFRTQSIVIGFLAITVVVLIGQSH